MVMRPHNGGAALGQRSIGDGACIAGDPSPTLGAAEPRNLHSGLEENSVQNHE